MINYATITVFDREFKKLEKRYPSLRGDIETLKNTVIKLYHLNQINPNAVFPIPGLCSQNGDYVSIKIKKFACRSLKGRGSNTGLRLIYVFEPSKKKVTFLEIYCKADKINEDRERIKEFIKKL